MQGRSATLISFPNRFIMERQRSDRFNSQRNTIRMRKFRTIILKFRISHNGELYQVMESFSEKKVMVEERLNGKMEIMLGDKSLSYRKIEVRPQKRQKPLRLLRIRPSIPMPADHPYRKTRDLM